MEIRPSARKHGIADEDIEHATKHVMASEYQDDGTIAALLHSGERALIATQLGDLDVVQGLDGVLS